MNPGLVILSVNTIWAMNPGRVILFVYDIRATHPGLVIRARVTGRVTLYVHFGLETQDE